MIAMNLATRASMIFLHMVPTIGNLSVTASA
jgi:hypothetical protein